MKYWEDLISKNVTYEYALNYIVNYPATSYITRPCWQGVHFISVKGEYCVLDKYGDVIEDVLNNTIWCVGGKDKNDWLIVTITDEAVEILREKGLL